MLSAQRLSATLFAGEGYIYSPKSLTLPSSFKPVLSHFLFLPVCSVGLISLLVYAEITGPVSPWLFGVGSLLLMLGLCIGLVYRIRKVQATEASPGRSPSPAESIKRLRMLIGIMVLLLLIGLWFTRGGPLLPWLVGVTINLLFIASLVSRLRRAKEAVNA
jgi:Ca2+/Na+ antiporter